MQLPKRKFTALVMIGLTSLASLFVVFPQTKAQTALLNEQFDYTDGYNVANLPTRPIPYSLIYTSPSIWYIKNAQLWCDNRPVGFYSFIELGDRSWVDYKVSVRFRLVGVDPARPDTYAVILHFRKPTIKYGDRLDLQLVGPTGGNMWKIVAEKEGSWYDYRVGGRLPVNIWDGSFHTLAVEAVRLNYRIFIDDANVGQFSEPRIGTITHESGSIGLANMGSLVAFDDLIVTPLTLGRLSVSAELGGNQVTATVEVSNAGTYTTPFEANLGVGNYQLQATYQGQTQKIQVSISENTRTSVRIVFADITQNPI